MEKSNSTTRAFSNLQDPKRSQENKPMGWQCSKKIEEMSPVCSTGLIASYLEPCIQLNFARKQWGWVKTVVTELTCVTNENYPWPKFLSQTPVWLNTNKKKPHLKSSFTTNSAQYTRKKKHGKHMMKITSSCCYIIYCMSWEWKLLSFFMCVMGMSLRSVVFCFLPLVC